ncbi:PIR Superfamily Protein [Plasmodium ovale curtisi]|uniref:PIR Superfamily Protein n=1 Tax=Plasmodium ovale curtisi TaxID=864141 RepID=A0A1A8X813_PLAOA|nr:PIR Superfamily Protein [Plasmodium ovale curtisi]
METDDYDTLNLTSNRCYTKLDTRYIIDGNDEKCKKLETTPGEYTNATLLCMGLKGNLKNYNLLDFFEKMKDYKCKYLSLWVHDRLSKIKEVDETTMKSTLFGIWGESENFENCNSSDFGSYLDSADYIKEKSLYDYALNYEDLENLYGKTDIIPCTTKLAEYIRKSIELYNKVKSECEPSKNNKIQRSCTALKDIQSIYPKDELLNLKCKRIEDESTPSREVEGSRTQPQHERQHEGNLKDHRSSVLGLDFTEDASTGPYASEDASSPDSHKAIGSTLPILGVLSIGFVLYKFTGLGPMARNFLRTKGINGINSHDGLTHELLDSTYDRNVHLDETKTYVGYQAI